MEGKRKKDRENEERIEKRKVGGKAKKRWGEEKTGEERTGQPFPVLPGSDTEG